MDGQDTDIKKQNLELKTQLNHSYQYINELTYRNDLTGLPNRKQLIKNFNTALNETKAHEKAILLIDIDRFHSTNELYGREIGDRLLIELSKRLKKLCGKTNTVYHIGEDEFIILQEKTPYAKLENVAKEIQEIVIKPFEIEGRALYINVSIGISHYPHTAQRIEKLLHQAEIALFKVKTVRKNGYQIILPQDTKIIERKRRIEFDLNEVIDNEELYLAYQPKISLTTGEVTAVEALLRWEHPKFGFISPGEFIPIAEESGIIKDIGLWVIYEAVRQTKEWHEKGYKISVAVNVSAIQFEDDLFVQRIIEILNYFELDPNYFIVEITESVMIDYENAEAIAKELNHHQIKIAIDDFGTGYSSLNVLNNMSIDMVKIDRSFIKDIPNHEKAVPLVKTMIQMGESLDFTIVAEGIETLEQKEFLIENNCDVGQGYYFSRPVSADRVISYIQNEKNDF